jgi:hypothetical protein
MTFLAMIAVFAGWALMMGLMVLMVYFGKYILAGISILTGDKESLQEFGNICDRNIPYGDTIWLPDEIPEDKRRNQWEQ